MTASIVQASCTMDAVVCDDTGTQMFGLHTFAPIGLAALFLVLVVVVFVLADRRSRR